MKKNMFVLSAILRVCSHKHCYMLSNILFHNCHENIDILSTHSNKIPNKTFRLNQSNSQDYFLRTKTDYNRRLQTQSDLFAKTSQLWHHNTWLYNNTNQFKYQTLWRCKYRAG